MNITFYGHSCFLIELAGSKLLFDPFITPNPKAAHMDIADLKPDFILLSHGHEDHVADALAIAQASEATIVACFEITSWYEQKGVTKVHPMNLGGKWQFPFGTVRFVPAVHSSVMPDGAYGGNPGGFVIESAEGNFYFAGDTALTLDMKLIPGYAKLDFAMLPLGDNFTMGVTDALRAMEFIECNRVIGMHFDTFGYIEINHNDTRKAFAEAGAELTLMEIGDQIDI